MKLRRIYFILLPLLMLTMAAGLCFGSAPLSFSELAAGEGTARTILLGIRLPRVLAGFLAGVGLSAAGVLLQIVTANELASPNLIGINSGAGLAVILLLTLAPKAGGWLPVGAFCGALGAALLILTAGNTVGSSRSGILLMGIAITTIFNAAISFLTLLDEGVLAQYNHFTVGSLRGLHMQELLVPGIIIFFGFCGALALSGRLSVLSLGDAAASALGVRVKALRLAALGCAAACAAAHLPATDDCGVVFNQSHAPMHSSYVDEEKTEKVFDLIKRSIEIAAIVGAKNIIVHPKQHLVYPEYKDVMREQNIEFYNKLLKQFKEGL